MTGPIALTPLDLLVAASLIGLNAALSLWLGLGLERKLLVASVRTVVQLTLLGYLLVPVFALHQPLIVFGMLAVMVTLAGREAVSRTERRFAGMVPSAFLAMTLGAGATALIGTAIIGVDPWWEPRYLIPLVGMILGNALTGVSLGMDRCTALLDDNRDRVDTLLAMGATRWEAARPIAAEAARTGMIPILNAMSAVGLVTIPGMMTGQILGGTDPVEAALYQVLIMFLIAAAVAIGVGASVMLTVRALFDDEHRLRPERLSKR